MNRINQALNKIYLSFFILSLTSNLAWSAFTTPPRAIAVSKIGPTPEEILRHESKILRFQLQADPTGNRRLDIDHIPSSLDKEAQQIVSEDDQSLYYHLWRYSMRFHYFKEANYPNFDTLAAPLKIKIVKEYTRKAFIVRRNGRVTRDGIEPTLVEKFSALNNNLGHSLIIQEPIERRCGGTHVVTTRPDAVSEQVIYEFKHKHVNGSEAVQYLTEQIRAQQQYARKSGKRHYLILTSNLETLPAGHEAFFYPVPSRNFADSNSLVFYFHLPSERIYQFSFTTNKWVLASLDDLVL